MPFPVTIDSSITVPRSQSKHRRSALRQALATSGALSATDGTEDLDRCAAVGTSSQLVELNDDLWLHILENVPARELTRLRTVSHDFCAKISHLLRARFRHLACSKQYEVLFESCAPAATRRNLRHRVTFSSFVSNDPSSIELAEFGFTGSTTASQSITLDDDQSFGNNILALHIRAVHASAKSPLHLEAPAEIWRAASSPPTLESYAWTMTVANGMNRVFRSWFERPDIPPPSPPSSPEYDSSDQETLLAPRPKAIKMLKPALGCAIHSAQIQCHLVHGIARDPRVTYQPLPGALPSRFEFAYESLKVDVARLVVGVEEGIRRSGHKERFLMWLRV